MPDHVHLLLEGRSEEADLVTFISRWKQSVAFELRNRVTGRVWQEGFHDRVLRQDASTLDVVAYIVTNPVRAGLAGNVAAYPFSGSGVFSREQLSDVVRMRSHSRRG
jgi:putative transposase